MKKILVAFALLINFSPLMAQNKQVSPIKLETTKDSVDYSLGALLGTMIKEAGLDIPNAEVFMKAMESYMKGDSLILSTNKMQSIIKEEGSRIQARELNKNIEEGKTFLAANAQNAGVVTLPSGLQYKIIEEGDINNKPNENDDLKVFYKGTLLNGTEFDAIDSDKAISLNLNNVIPGWKEGMRLIGKGGRIVLYIPSSLAYGDRRLNTVPAGSLLIFDITLIDVQKKAAIAKGGKNVKK